MRCNLCTLDSVRTMIEFGSHPIAHRLLTTSTAEEYTHPVTLGVCDSCGLSQLIDPVPSEELYSTCNVRAAWKTNPHIPSLLEWIRNLSWSTADPLILEVGCSDGSFLQEVRSLGHRRLLGVEPAGNLCEEVASRGIEIRNAFFSRETAEEIVDTHGPCDLFIARSVVEHISDLPDFAAALNIVLGPDAHVLIEVPDFEFVQQYLDYGLIWEEHVNQFTKETLGRLFVDSGVELQDVSTVNFSGRMLVAFGRRTNGSRPSALTPSELEGLLHGAERLRDRWPQFRDSVTERLESYRASDQSVALYGAGCRSIGFVNYCGVGRFLDCVYDDQPEKQNNFFPGARLPIVPGDELHSRQPALCLLGVNEENETAVIGRRQGFRTAGGEFLSIHPPSALLPDFWHHLRLS